MVEYLESVHIREFLTGSMHEVKQSISIQKIEDLHYEDPTQTMSILSPDKCRDNTFHNDICCDCQALETWWDRFRSTVDDLIFKSNVHTCRGQKSDEKAVKKDRPDCINKHGNCKARFPREVFEQTEVNPKTGALNIKKGEA